MTISGPAAGLAPVLYAGMISLGSGDLEIGYPRMLAAICIAGVLQFVLARLKVARLSAIFPAAAIEGMLAAIGLMIIVKQAPLLLGQKFEAHEFWEILGEIPAKMATMNPQVFWLAIGCTALIFTLSIIPSRLLKVMPPPVWAFVVGTVVANLFLALRPENLINVPEVAVGQWDRAARFHGNLSRPKAVAGTNDGGGDVGVDRRHRKPGHDRGRR